MDAQTLNRTLKYYGTNPFGEPLFRIVWSDSEREKRHGTFNEFVGSFFLRTVTEVREVPKYPYIAHRWVLERWLSPLELGNTELAEPNRGSYEPVYVYQDENGNYLPLNEDFTMQIIQTSFNPTLPGDRKSRLQTEADKAETKEIQENYDKMENDLPWLINQMKTGEAIVVPSNYKKENDDAGKAS